MFYLKNTNLKKQICVNIYIYIGPAGLEPTAFGAWTQRVTFTPQAHSIFFYSMLWIGIEPTHLPWKGKILPLDYQSVVVHKIYYKLKIPPV